MGLMSPTFEDDRDADDQPGPDRAERRPAPGTGPTDPSRKHRTALGPARGHCVAGGGRPPERADRGVDQVEIYFSIIARKALSPNDCDDLDVVIERLPAFETRYNQAAKPFKWKFTTTDLADLLDRLDRHRPAISTDPVQPRAA